MTKIEYVPKMFRSETLDLIDLASDIIDEYQGQGFVLTLRQLYYQMVARDVIPNTERSYKRMGSIVADARLAGLLSWEAIEDRTRNIRHNPHWDKPQDIIRDAAEQFRIDVWADQEWAPEVWIEKDALVGVIERVCTRLDIPYFSCRGYTSLSEIWNAGHHRIRGAIDAGRKPLIIHLGDHDPSGIDMTRDIIERLEMFAGESILVSRIALNRDQIDQYNPPPNPAKLSDSRCRRYIAEHGSSSWELDALDPSTIERLVEDEVMMYADPDLLDASIARQEVHRKKLAEVASRFDEFTGGDDGQED